KLRVGQNSTLTSNGNTGGSWNSSNPQVATVNGPGTVNALSVGSTNITYTASATGCASAMTDTVLTIFAATLTNIYPNPASDNVNVVIDATAFENITIVIIDMSGRLVITQSGNVRPGLNNRAINISKLSGGIYTLKTLNSAGRETFTTRFIKQQ
ncbi:MAG: T9SS type A sorting domain-containing protein, partial [Chitinophagaceae bacterium]